MLPLIAFYAYFKYRFEYDPKKKFLLMEYFADIRNWSVARLYTALLLSRRLIFVSLIIFLPDAPREVIYSTLLGNPKRFIILAIQAGYIVSLIILRPFENLTNNLIDIVNEFFLTAI